MRNFIATIAAACTMALPLAAAASTWTIDPEHSNVGFKVRHMMVSNVRGSFEKHNGIIELDDKDITKSRIQVTIDTASINTGIQKRDDHLRSADFLEVAKYPTMTFVSRKVVKGGNGLKVTGDLTLRGVTRTVVLDVEGPSAESKDPWGNIRKGATATTKISRKDFGLLWNAALETGGVAVGDEVNIILEIEAIRK